MGGGAAMTMLLAAATASAACPAEWLKLCPDQDCVPLQAPFPTHEVLGFRAGMYGCGGAGCYQNSWTQYNYSIVKTVLNGDFVINLTNIACQQHARGGRVTVGHALGFGAFNHTRLYDAAYRTAWVTAGVKVMKTSYPFVDGVNVDLERFPRNYITPYGLTDLVCEMHTQLQAVGLRVHSIDMPPYGHDVIRRAGIFDPKKLAECVSYLVPMAYSNPNSSTEAWPTGALDLIKQEIHRGYLDIGIPPSKLIIGLPFFGYDFVCNNSRPATWPTNHTCALSPPAYPQIGRIQALQLYANATAKCDPALKQPRVGPGPACGSWSGPTMYDEAKASSWFEYTGAGTGARHQVWIDDARSTAAKAAWAWGIGVHGLAFWTADALYAPDGRDSEAAQEMWAAAAPPPALL